VTGDCHAGIRGSRGLRRPRPPDHTLRAQLLTDDGEPVDADGEAIEATGNFEVGRPPGIKPGSDLDAPFVVPFQLALSAGGYVWELEIDGEPTARTPFRVLDGVE